MNVHGDLEALLFQFYSRPNKGVNMTYKLILLRHGESQWNLENRFTGWTDVPLTEKGLAEGKAAGNEMAAAGLEVAEAHSSLMLRANRTLQEALFAMGRFWIPVHKNWRLNERHYGALQGLNKSETTAKHGEEQVFAWRRSYDVPPPALDKSDERHPSQDSRYSSLPAELLPGTECLKDVVERVLPYWYDSIVPSLQRSGTVLVAAHGNSLRALVKHLEGISDEEIAGVNIPTGAPLLFELDEDLSVLSKRYLGDAEAVAAAAAAVAAQATAD